MDVLQVLYEDNHLIAVFKPAGMLTQNDSASGESLMTVTKRWLKEKYAKPGNVFLGLLHRLDKPVSGVVLFAKTSKGASRLSEQFRGRDIKKVYHAWVEGEAPASGRLTHYLSAEALPRVAVSTEPAPEMKKAVLSFRRLGFRNGQSHLEVELETGRKHQIRAQLSFIGHPICGDAKYGAKKRDEGEIALLAKRLEFRHPVTGEPIKVESP